MQYAGRFFVGSASLDAQSLRWLTGRNTGGGGIGMDLRPFGRTGLMISPVTLGSMEFGSKVDESEAAEVFGRSGCWCQRHRYGQCVRLWQERGSRRPIDQWDARQVDLGDQVLRADRQPGSELGRHVTPHC